MILVLGGTGEARALAAALVEHHQPVISSLAGRVSRPALPVGSVRIGGFGGVTGLVDFLRSAKITRVVDATHPFAAQISVHAVEATAVTGVPLLRLERPGWRQHPLADTWSWVPATAAAVSAGGRAARPFLTTGRQSLDVFRVWADRSVLVRVVDPPKTPAPARWTMIVSRGPYTLADERALMVDHAVDLLVTKDSGGSLTEAKLLAAAELGVPVVIIGRPAGSVGVATVDGVRPALEWLDRNPLE